MPEIEVNGVPLYYRDEGPGGPAGTGTGTSVGASRADEVVVLVHGNVASSRWWEKVIPGLCGGYRVIAPDLRGFGRSGKPGHGYTIRQYAADLAALAEVLGLSAAHWVGHSLGGSVVLQLALDHPERARSLCLIDPGPAEGLLTPEERFPLLALTARNRDYMKAALAGIAAGAPRDAYFEALVDDAMAAGEVLVPNARDLNAWNVQARLGEIRVSALIVQGEQDPLVPLEAVRRTAAGIPGARLEVMPGVGHSPPIERPAAVVELIVTALLPHVDIL